MPQSNGTTQRIVIVGGGAGGLELAAMLSRRNGAGRAFSVTLIDRHISHLWKPRLHEVAVGLQSVAEEEVSFFAHALQHGYAFEWGGLTAVDTVNRSVTVSEARSSSGSVVLPERVVGYDRLVLAIGSEPNDFGTPGAAEHCLFLNDRTDAMKIRSRLLSNVLRLSRGIIPQLNIVIVGGGATGVELAADFYHSSAQVSAYGGPIRPNTLSTTVIDTADRLLSANPPEVSAYAAEALTRLGIQLCLESKVVNVHEHGVTLASGREVAADVIIWTAGIKGPSLFKNLTTLVTKPNGRVVVDKTLRTSDPDVYAMGDCAEWLDPDTGRPAPYTAQVASAQASYLAAALPRELSGHVPEAFRFHNAGALVALGDKTAAGNLTTRVGRRSREHIVQGTSAKWLYALLYRQHQYRLYGLPRTVAIVLSDWLSRKVRPMLKLH